MWWKYHEWITHIMKSKGEVVYVLVMEAHRGRGRTVLIPNVCTSWGWHPSLFTPWERKHFTHSVKAAGSMNQSWHFQGRDDFLPSLGIELWIYQSMPYCTVLTTLLWPHFNISFKGSVSAQSLSRDWKVTSCLAE